MPQRRWTSSVHQRGRRGVQGVPASGPQRLVDRRPHERMRKRQRPRRRRLGDPQQIVPGRLVDGVERVGRPPRAPRPAATRSAGRARPRRRSAGGSVCARRIPVLHQPTERPRRGQQLVVATPLRRRELLQQRAGVQRVALRAVAQAPGRDRRRCRRCPSPTARSRRSSSSSPRSRRTVPRCPLTSRPRLSGQVGDTVVADGDQVSTWSAASRRSAKISACSDGRSAQLRVVDGQDHGGRPGWIRRSSRNSSSRVPTVTGSSTGSRAGAPTAIRSAGAGDARRTGHADRPRPVARPRRRPAAPRFPRRWPVPRQVLASGRISARKWSSSAVLPIPAGPWICTIWGRPASASTRRARRTASSGWRPTNGAIASLLVCERVRLGSGVTARRLNLADPTADCCRRSVTVGSDTGAPTATAPRGSGACSTPWCSARPTSELEQLVVPVGSDLADHLRIVEAQQADTRGVGVLQRHGIGNADAHPAADHRDECLRGVDGRPWGGFEPPGGQQRDDLGSAFIDMPLITSGWPVSWCGEMSAYRPSASESGTTTADRARS